MSKVWQPQDQTGASYIGLLEIADGDDFHVISVVKTVDNSHFVFGGVCNTGLLESGNFEIDQVFSDDENLETLVEDLESYYRDGKGYQSDNFTCNDRM